MPLPARTVAFFLFNDTATTEIYTLSLHDALPIFSFLDDGPTASAVTVSAATVGVDETPGVQTIGGESTRLSSSHANIYCGVFRFEEEVSGRVKQGPEHRLSRQFPGKRWPSLSLDG